MSRFFVPTESIEGKVITISGSDANHISNVLRMKKGEEIILCDSHGNDYKCHIADATGERVVCEISEVSKNISESDIKITLFQGMPKSDKMELIIQKCVELGVYRIVPMITEHTVVKTNDKTKKKVERWQKISESAAKQSGRGIIPEICQPVLFKDAVKAAQGQGMLIPYENETENTLKGFLQKYDGKELAVFIGPEGGFSKEEAEFAGQAGAASVTLGKRILRTETAAIAVCAVIMYEKDL